MNKNLLLSFFLVLCTGFLTAQSFTIEPIPASGTANLQDPSSYPGDVVAHAQVTNNTNAELTINWRRTEVTLPVDWKTGVCDINTCYGSDVGRETFILQPNATGLLDVHAYPGGIPGSLENGANPGEAVIHVKLTNANDNTDTLTAVYNIEVTGAPVFPVSTNEQEIEALKLYPNPTTDFFQLSPTDNGVEKVAVFNILGRRVEEFAANDTRFDVSNLPHGFYLVSLLDEKEQILKTMRLQKR